MDNRPGSDVVTEAPAHDQQAERPRRKRAKALRPPPVLIGNTHADSSDGSAEAVRLIQQWCARFCCSWRWGMSIIAAINDGTIRVAISADGRLKTKPDKFIKELQRVGFYPPSEPRPKPGAPPARPTMMRQCPRCGRFTPCGVHAKDGNAARLRTLGDIADFDRRRPLTDIAGIGEKEDDAVGAMMRPLITRFPKDWRKILIRMTTLAKPIVATLKIGVVRDPCEDCYWATLPAWMWELPPSPSAMAIQHAQAYGLRLRQRRLRQGKLPPYPRAAEAAE